MSESRGLIASFTEHKVASNLLMLLMVMLGFLGLNRLNTQLFPDFDFDYITVTIPWRGASPEDVQRSITIPVEQAIKTLPNTKKLIARSQQGASAIFIELEDGTDLGLALDEVRQRMARLISFRCYGVQRRLGQVVLRAIGSFPQPMRMTTARFEQTHQ